MRQLLISSLALLLFTGCKKQHSARVDIYLLESFNSTVDQSTNPATVSITNAVLEKSPLVADQDIEYYTKSSTTFHLRKDIQSIIQNYGPDKAFAVTVDQLPVYYGRFHPLYLSSITFGVATIAPPMLNENELKIDFAKVDGNTFLEQLDKRNESRIINALNTTGRLR